MDVKIKRIIKCKRVDKYIDGRDIHKGYTHDGTYTQRDIYMEDIYRRKGYMHKGTYTRR